MAFGFLGINFHVKDVKVRKAGRVADGHEARQVEPMRVAMWSVLECMLRDLNDFRKILAFFWVFMMVTVVRPKNLQSSVIAVAGFCFEGHCALSKARI